MPTRTTDPASATATTPAPPSLRRRRGTGRHGHSLHVGARGPTYEKRAIDSAIQRQYGVIPGIELRGRGVPDVLREIRERMAGRPTYLCFDMDFFDPSCAPGVCTPAWG